MPYVGSIPSREHQAYVEERDRAHASEQEGEGEFYFHLSKQHTLFKLNRRQDQWQDEGRGALPFGFYWGQVRQLWIQFIKWIIFLLSGSTSLLSGLSVWLLGPQGLFEAFKSTTQRRWGIMITINKALFILHDELISGPGTALSNVMKEKVTWYSVVRLPLLRCDPVSAF